MKVKELIEDLKKYDPNAEVWTGASTPNQNIPTYGLVDHIYQNDFESFWTDLFPTSDNIDERLYNGQCGKDNVVYIGTTFGRWNIHNKVNNMYYKVRTKKNDTGYEVQVKKHWWSRWSVVIFVGFAGEAINIANSLLNQSFKKEIKNTNE